MAKVIAGQAHRGNLLADEFLYHADMLASLRREGVLVLGTLYPALRCWLQWIAATAHPGAVEGSSGSLPAA